jgi:hypothetical protein
LMKSIIQTHKHALTNCWQLLLILFNIEEWHCVMLAALKWLEDHAPEGTLNAQAYTHVHFPKKVPHWDSNNSWDYQWLESYQEALLGGMKEGGKKAMNVSKTSEVLQGPDESTSQFYKLLYEGFHCTPSLTQKPLKTSGW